MADQSQIELQLLDRLSALTNQIERLNEYYDHNVQQKTRQPPIVDPNAVRVGGGMSSGARDYLTGGAEGLGNLDTRYAPPQGDRARLIQEYRNRVGEDNRSIRGRLGAAAGAIGSFAPPLPSNEPPTDDEIGRRSPQGSGGSLPIPGLTNPIARGMRGGAGNMDDQQAVTWALLGEHGGPSFVRNLALESYGINRSLGWAQNMSAKMGAYGRDNTGVLPSIASAAGGDTVRGALEIAKNHPLAAYGAYKAAQGVGAINTHLSTMQTIGEQFGYGPPAGGRSLFGFRNPLGGLGTSAQVGLSFEMEKQALMGRIPGQGFGSGLSKQQATETLDTLGNQGFGMQPASFTGDAATIAQNFFRPIMTRTPGVSAQDLGQFTGNFRNGATSTQQMADALRDLGTQARITKETIGQVTTSLAQTSQQFESMGSTPQGGLGVAAGFTRTTGLPAQVAGQIAQNPLFQGMALSQGILPSGLGDLNPGTFAQIGGNEMSMLYKMLKPGLGQSKYQMVNGHPVMIQSGDTAVFDQMSRMTGIASNQIRRMVGDQSHIQAAGKAQAMLGDSNQGTGFYQLLTQHPGKLNKQEYTYAQKVWNDTVANTYQGTGVSRAQMDKINKIPGMRNRANAYNQALGNATKDDPWNQIQQGPTGQKVSIELTGEAKRIFRVAHITDDKAASNAGQDSITQAANSVLGWNRTSTSGTGAVAFARH